MVLDGVTTRVPAAVVVPNVSKLVEVVLIIPLVMVNVPLTDNGFVKVTPVALLLLMLTSTKLAVGDVAAF